MLSGEQSKIFRNAVGAIAATLSSPRQEGARRPVLYDAGGRPLSPSKNAFAAYSRSAAQRKGSLKTWIPRQLSVSQAAIEREAIAERAIALTNDDPMAAGVRESFANSVVGSGLLPHPTMDREALGIDDATEARIVAGQKAVWKKWSPFADAGGRWSANQLLWMAENSMVTFGEYIWILPMRRDPVRPYSLCVQAINPMRLKTPMDLRTRQNIKDGVEVGKYNEPIAYWIKKGDSSAFGTDLSSNFVRVRARSGHRWRVIHQFAPRDPEATRGISDFAASMKFFKDLSDYLNAELVSNIVTAAFSMFVEIGPDSDPYSEATKYATISETAYKSDQTEYTRTYEELEPGAIYYGNTGEKPHVISAQRPGSTFEPFVKLIAKSIANSVGISYPVLFRDFEGMNYASYRSAMLEAWRVFSARRRWLGQGGALTLWRMLQEEAYLRGEVDYPDFYSNYWLYTAADWIGPPKGQIEPIKEIKADILAIENNLKTRSETMAEYQRDFDATVDRLKEEKQALDDAELTSAGPEAVSDSDNIDTDDAGETEQ